MCSQFNVMGVRALPEQMVAHDGAAMCNTKTQPSAMVPRGALYRPVRGADTQLPASITRGAVIRAHAV